MSSPAGELVSTDTDVIRRVHGFRVRDSGHFSISVFARTRSVIQLAGTHYKAQFMLSLGLIGRS